MASQQKRLLTIANSKLGKQDIVRLLDKDDAWILLPIEDRTQLYTLLPEPEDGEPPHDPDVHPLRTRYKTYIQNELRRWQNDLIEGREVKKWREEAMKASRDRVQGKFDEWKELQREEDWGKIEDDVENLPPSHEDGNQDERKEKEVDQEADSRSLANELHSNPGNGVINESAQLENVPKDELNGVGDGGDVIAGTSTSESRPGNKPKVHEDN